MDSNIFFPQPVLGQNGDEARRVCRQCAVWEECATWAIMNGQTRGIYGGMNLRERRIWSRERNIVRPHFTGRLPTRD